MPERTICLVREGFPEAMALDTAVSRVLLTEASQGTRAETLRLTIPGRSLAFGKHDVVSAGFAEAVEAARDAGFEPFVRLAGGRVAAFHEGTIAVSWVIPHPRPIETIRARFIAVTGAIVDAFESLGIGAGVGALPGEYCPGEFSVHVGSSKVAGFGQRLSRSAAHIGGVIVVDDGALVRRVLVPAYDALGLDWDPATAGALSDGRHGLHTGVVIEAILARLGADNRIEEVALDATTISSARQIAGDFTPP